ncbi:MAG: hypothetical protein HYU54_07485, partial [Actinobacteria bacterium]|nr:hypothetical protein [Actinomycetota bacterium]
VLSAMAERGWGPSGNGHARAAPVALLESEAPCHTHGRQSGSDFCTHCGSCMEPAIYERDKRGVPASTAEMIDRLDRFTELVWRTEPQDVRRLRQLSRPPMGRMPGIVYANFNLFWLGENLQTIRDRARGTLSIATLNEMLSAACLRSAIRLSKWHLLDIIFLLSDVVGFADKVGCRDHAEMKALVEHLLLAVDRVQTWVDRTIPWHRMDAVMEPVG